MEAECSLPCSHESAIGPYSTPDDFLILKNKTGLMRSSCCLCASLTFVRRLIRSPCYLSVYPLPKFVRFLQSPYRIKADEAISSSQHFKLHYPFICSYVSRVACSLEIFRLSFCVNFSSLKTIAHSSKISHQIFQHLEKARV
jgi:hypothetical protein